MGDANKSHTASGITLSYNNLRHLYARVNFGFFLSSWVMVSSYGNEETLACSAFRLRVGVVGLRILLLLHSLYQQMWFGLLTSTIAGVWRPPCGSFHCHGPWPCAHCPIDPMEVIPYQPNLRSHQVTMNYKKVCKHNKCL